jgi:hypothetical protein
LLHTRKHKRKMLHLSSMCKNHISNVSQHKSSYQIPMINCIGLDFQWRTGQSSGTIFLVSKLISVNTALLARCPWLSAADLPSAHGTSSDGHEGNVNCGLGCHAWSQVELLACSLKDGDSAADVVTATLVEAILTP